MDIFQIQEQNVTGSSKLNLCQKLKPALELQVNIGNKNFFLKKPELKFPVED